MNIATARKIVSNPVGRSDDPALQFKAKVELRKARKRRRQHIKRNRQ